MKALAVNKPDALERLSGRHVRGKIVAVIGHQNMLWQTATG